MASIIIQGIKFSYHDTISHIQSTIAIAHHPEFHARTKHIDIATHFLCDHVQKGTLDLYYINTEFNLADIFTKPL